MSLPDRNNPYSFEEFLSRRKNVDYYADDPFIQKVVRHFTGSQWEQVDAEARAVSAKASFRWRDMADAIARPERSAPTCCTTTGTTTASTASSARGKRKSWNGRYFPKASSPTRPPLGQAHQDVPHLPERRGLHRLSPHLHRGARGMLLEPLPTRRRRNGSCTHCKEGIDGEFAIGAQYLSEIQGGSDVPSNVLEAVKEGGTWRLYGTKFFCSATHADYAVVTAKPAGSEKVALFVMPSWLPGNREKEIRNGYTIDRIKWKTGHERTHHGGNDLQRRRGLSRRAPRDSGVANVVGIVLTYSRLTVGLSAAAFMTRAVREAKTVCRIPRGLRPPDRQIPHGGGPAPADGTCREADHRRRVQALPRFPGARGRAEGRHRRGRAGGGPEEALRHPGAHHAPEDRRLVGLHRRDPRGHVDLRRPRRHGGLLVASRASTATPPSTSSGRGRATSSSRRFTGTCRRRPPGTSRPTSSGTSFRVSTQRSWSRWRPS